MGLRCRCLIVDHDDTAVESTAAIHYPAHLAALKVLRPGRRPPTLEEFFLSNFHGFMEYLTDDLRLNQQELVTAFDMWREWTAGKIPPFFPGFLELLRDFRSAGGLVAVVSHSDADTIRTHYAAVEAPPFVPDVIFGWENDAGRRKPSPWPAQEALRRLGCAPHEALIVDDLKPGFLMSRASGIRFVAAGWAYSVPEIEAYMRAEASAYCSQVRDLRELVFGNEA